ncbi:hypothetical protein N7492_005469 [Penicillium capsulatum]|uniref:Uncharacterized protein n=1 Tax=Penicillium capsulatum TaxID=69766 RepID=A0A9W9ICI9_9EURO|nr:hypothetical protein N7492_005469 [Penicillium capsulatum]KAJ6135430.1 hypothetical protein N7512_000590 [Penicillium capsulatum]
MGRSSPPFLYDRPSTYSLYGPTDRPFNPKAATEASRTRAPPKPQPKGPLLDINRHPDSWVSFDRSTWTPMNPKTKSRVKCARGTQFGLRIVTLLGALCSLFCSVVIKGAAVTVIWIIRAGPIVAILHTIYGIYHLARSPVNRPPASQASYGLFASTLDVGLIAFYVFTAVIAYGQWSKDAYHWGTLFEISDATVKIAEATFICAVANAGLHLISFAISIYLAITFRRISHLPPDMNPLEDNLTARPRKNRNRKQDELDEKHMSQSTLNSTSEDPLIGAPRTVPFIHTRDQSLGGETYRGSMDIMSEKRQSQVLAHPHRLSHLEPTSPEVPFQHAEDQRFDITSQTPAPEFRNVTAHSPEFVAPSAQLRHLTSRAADRSNSVSPLSDNWVAFSDRSLSPMSDVQGQGQNANENAIRQSSSVYSRRTNGTDTSTGSGIRDWFAYGQKPASIGSVIQEDTRGEYASLAMHEYYGNEDENKSHEQDLGDRRFNIFPDPEDHDNDRDDGQTDGLPFNPLMLNPPTPQPVFTESLEDTDPVRRNALGDNPNLSQTPKAQVTVPHESEDTTPKKARFYGNLEGEENLGHSKPRVVSGQDNVSRKPSKLSKKRSKMAAYQSLKKDDSDDEGHLHVHDPSSPSMTEGDRKGRVVSNSGADTARPSFVGGVGASLSSYGSYIAGLGVGRRRDVSGKVAEEGRSAANDNERVVPAPQTQTQSQNASPIRAAGWARFAGL